MAGSVVASASIGGGTTSLTCAKPTGTASGDVMVAFQSGDWATLAGMTAPTGWSVVGSQDQGSNNQHMKVWVKTAGGSEGSSYAFVQGANSDGTVTIVTTRGTTATGILSAFTFDNNGSTTRTAPSVTGATSGAVLLCAAMVEGTGDASQTTTWTPPSGMTEQGDIQSQGLWTSQGVASLLGPASPSGTKSFTSSQAPGNGVGGIQATIIVLASSTASTINGTATATLGGLTATATAVGATPLISAVGSMVSHNNQPCALTEAVPVSPTAIGDVLAVATETKYTGQTPFVVTGLSGGGVTVWNKADGYASIDAAHGTELWWGVITATGSQTLTVSYNPNSATRGDSTSATSVDVQQFHSTTGAATAWSVDATGRVDPNTNGTNPPYPTLTPTAGNTDCYWGYLAITGSVSAGSTSGCVYQTDIRGNQTVYNTAVSASITPVSASGTSQKYFSIGMLLAAGGNVTGVAAATFGELGAAATATVVTTVKASTLTDRFTGTIDTAKWPNNLGTVSQTGGVATVASGTTLSAFGSADIYDCTNTAVFARVTPPSVGTATKARAAIGYYLDPPTYSQHLFIAADSAANQVVWSYVVSGATQWTGSVTYDATNHAWLRMEEAAGTVSFKASPDGLTWSTLGSHATPAAMTASGIAEIDLESTRDTGTGTASTFDNLNIAPVTAVAATVLGGLTGAATAHVSHTATGSAALGALSASSTATVKRSATATATLGGLTSTATATVNRLASAAAPSGALTATAVAGVAHSATGVAALGALAAAGVGTRIWGGTATAALAALTGTANAVVTAPAAASAPLGGLTATAGASVQHPATGSAPLAALAAAATGSRIWGGDATADLGQLTASGSALVTHDATATADLGGLAGAATAVRGTTATAAATLGALTAAAAGTSTSVGTGTAAAALGGLTGEAAAVTGVIAVAYAGPSVESDYPSEDGYPAEDLYPGDGTPLGLGALVATSTATRTTAGIASGALGALAATASGTVTAEEITATATADVGALAGDAAATVTVTGTAAAILAGLGGSAVGSSFGAGAGTATGPLGGLTAAASAVVEHLVSADAPLAALTALGSAGIAHDASASALLGDLVAAATGTAAGVEHEGTATAAFAALTGVATAGVTHSAAAAADLGALTGAVTGARETNAAADAPLGALTGAATGVVTPVGTGTGAATLGDLNAVATAVVGHPAAAAADLGAFAAHATAGRTTTGTAVAPFGALAVVAAGAVIPPSSGIATADLGALAAVAAGTVGHAAAGGAALGGLIAAAVAITDVLAVAGASLGSLHAAGVGHVPSAGSPPVHAGTPVVRSGVRAGVPVVSELVHAGTPDLSH